MKISARHLATLLAALRNWQVTLANLGVDAGTPAKPAELGKFATYFEKVTPLSEDEIDDFCVALNLGDDDPAAIDLFDPANEPLIIAAAKAYEQARTDADRTALRPGTTIAIVFDRIANAEDPSPFGFCPPGSVPILFKQGTVIGTVTSSL